MFHGCTCGTDDFPAFAERPGANLRNDVLESCGFGAVYIREPLVGGGERLRERVQYGLQFLRRDPLLLALIGLIVLALIPMPFLGYRLAHQRDEGPDPTPVVILPTATITPSPLPTATPTPVPTATPTPTPTPTPTVLVAPLSGLELDPASLQRPPIVVMIPSDSEQYGISQASVVFEAVAEYQIPRFLNIFEHVEADQLGPVRSARPYYVQWCCPYGPLYVHAGGSPQALSMLAESDCHYNLEALIYEGVYFWRGVDENIPWNNMFTSSELLYEYLDNWELDPLMEYRGFLHKDDAPLEERPMTGTLSLSFSYSVRYTYDRESNAYLREYKGRPHLDMLTGEQHQVRNVVVIFVPQARIPDDPKGRMEFETVGEGKALIFMDGFLIEGDWVKESPEAELRFLDGSGEEVAFNRGNIWIEVLEPDQSVNYALGKPTP